MAQEGSDPIERWTAKRRVALVVSILKGDTSIAEAARQHGLTVAEMENWREKFLLGEENVLRTHPKDEEAIKDEQINALGGLAKNRLKPARRRELPRGFTGRFR